MLKIVVPEWEDWDPVKEKFIRGQETTLTMEHSLVSISKWESKYHKPFMNTKNLTVEEALDYFRFMTISSSNKLAGDGVYQHLGEENIKAIYAYIGDPMTATTINSKDKGRMKKEVVTSELVYYWMTALNIPFECQKWHFNRLMTLIGVASIKQQPSKKMGRRDIIAQNKALNEARRAKHHSRG